MPARVFVCLAICRYAPVGVSLLIDRGVLPSAQEEEMVR
jgi:hypothetical protein